MLRKKYKKKNNDLIEDIIKAGTETCILKIQLKAVSKLEHHFIYEVSYLDQGKVKTIPIFACNVTEIIDILEPYVNKGLSEQATAFGVGSSEEIILSRKESSTFRPDEKTVFSPKSKNNEKD